MPDNQGSVVRFSAPHYTFRLVLSNIICVLCFGGIFYLMLCYGFRGEFVWFGRLDRIFFTAFTMASGLFLYGNYVTEKNIL